MSLASDSRFGTLCAVLAAVLFGASTPVSKFLLGHIQPTLLAGLLYLGSGIGLSAWRLAARVLRPGKISPEAPLRRQHWPWLSLAILFGGILGPVLLLLDSRPP